MSEQTFTLIEGKEKGKAHLDYLYGQTAEPRQVTAAELEEYFNSTSQLSNAFGSFDNYLAYMTERESLIQSGEYDVGSWGESTGRTEEEEFILSADNDVWTPETDDADFEAQQAQDTLSNQQGAYNNWINSDANQALLEKYGVTDTVTGADGDVFKWNGSGYVKTEDVTTGKGDYFKAAMIAAMGYYAGGGISEALSGLGGGSAGGFSGVLQASAGNALGSAIAQGALTGSVDLSEVVQAGITAGLGELAGMAADGALAASSDIGAAADNLAWDLADALGTDVETIYEMATGIASGAIQGDSVEEMVAGAVGTYSADQLMNYVRTNFADSFGDIEVDNWFDEGTTSIDVRAFEPFVDVAIGGALGDDVDATDILGAIWESGTQEAGENPFEQEGTFAYADPTRGEAGGFFDSLGNFIPDIDLPSLDLELPEFDVNLPDVDLPDVDLDLPDVDIDLPDVDTPDVNLDAPDVSLDTPDVDAPDVDLPSVDLDLGRGMLGGAKAALAKPQGYFSSIGYNPNLNYQVTAASPVSASTSALNELIARNLSS